MVLLCLQTNGSSVAPASRLQLGFSHTMLDPGYNTRPQTNTGAHKAEHLGWSRAQLGICRLWTKLRILILVLGRKTKTEL